MGPEKTQYKCHVIVIPYPSQGHINPLLQFAKRLSSKGIKATFATTPYTLSSISDPSISLESISDGFDLGGFSQARNPDLYLKSFKTHGSKTLSQLIEKYNSSSTPIDCVIYDSFFPWALDVAKQHGLFGALFFTNSAAVCADFCRIRLGVLGLPVRRKESPLVVPGLPPPLSFGDLPTFLRAPDCYPAYLAMTLSPFSNLDGADCIFCNSFEELEGQK